MDISFSSTDSNHPSSLFFTFVCSLSVAMIARVMEKLDGKSCVASEFSNEAYNHRQLCTDSAMLSEVQFL